MAVPLAVVNDDPTFLAFLGETLSAQGYDPHLFRVAVANVRHILAAAPRAIVLDIPLERAAVQWRMFDRLVAGLAAQPRPLIVCAPATAAGRARLARSPYRRTHLLAKPFEVSQLLEALRATLGDA